MGRTTSVGAIGRYSSLCGIEHRGETASPHLFSISPHYGEIFFFMTRLIFLLPPSEGKHPDGRLSEEILSFPHQKPLEIAVGATEKDLKCSGHRYEATKFLNTHITKSTTLPAIERYDGVMFRALSYMHLSEA